MFVFARVLRDGRILLQTEVRKSRMGMADNTGVVQVFILFFLGEGGVWEEFIGQL